METNIRALKGLLHRKDDEIFSLQSLSATLYESSSTLSPVNAEHAKTELDFDKQKILGDQFPGTNSTSDVRTAFSDTAFVEVFGSWPQEDGMEGIELSSGDFIQISSAASFMSPGSVSETLPRLISDRYISEYQKSPD